MPASSSLLLFALGHPAGAHPDHVAHVNLWRTWTFEPFVVASLVATGILYTIGVRRLWRAAGPGQGVSRVQVASFVAGCLAVVAALVSPVDAISNELFSVHMVQHELLMIV